MCSIIRKFIQSVRDRGIHMGEIVNYGGTQNTIFEIRNRREAKLVDQISEIRLGFCVLEDVDRITKLTKDDFAEVEFDICLMHEI